MMRELAETRSPLADHEGRRITREIVPWISGRSGIASTGRVAAVPRLRCMIATPGQEIVLARVEHALCVREAMRQFENGHTFVDVVNEAGQIERREVRTGLTDGIYVEVLSGIVLEDAVRVPARE